MRAQHCRLQLSKREHQRRHVEVAVENVADSSLAADRHPLPNQVSDIPVHGALRYLQLSSQLARGDRPA